MKKCVGLLLALCVTAFPCLAQYKLYEAGLAKYNEKEYYETISLLSDFLTKPQRDKKFDVDAYYWRGLATFKVNNFAEAAEDLEKAKQLKYKNKGNLDWFLAQCYVKLERHNEALVEYGNALRELQADKAAQPKLLKERAAVYVKLGITASAIQDLQIASSLNPTDAEIKAQLAALNDPNTKNAVTQTVSPPVANVESKKTETQTSRGAPAAVPVVVPEKKPEVSKPVEPEKKEPTLADLYADEKRFALVIGNSAYSKEIGVLKNPVNDATDMAKALKDMNFDVTLITDATYGKIRVEMMKFRDKLNQGERDKTVGLFFYAGHGLQYDNENYIVPVDAQIQDEFDIARFCWPIQKQVLGFMETTNSRMNIVILDACRNNPYPALHRSVGESGGLGEMKKARGAFIAYATSPGSVASDGSSRNGLYTQELIKAMNKPGRTIEQVFKDVRGNVLRQSGDKQNPWENSNITGDFYFKF